MYPFISLFGIITIPSYGLSIAIACLLCGNLVIRRAKSLGLDGDDALLILVYGIVSGFIGAKILYVLTILPQLGSIISELTLESFAQIASSGFVFYGGVLGGAAGVLLCKAIHKIELSKYFYIIIYCPLAHGIGRIGCFLAGCCYGMETHTFGITFHNSIVAPNGVPLLPIQLIEAAAEFVIFAILHFAFKKKKGYSCIFLYIYLYAPVRFILEYFRADVGRGYFLMFSTSQWLSISLVAVAAIVQTVLIVHSKIKKVNADANL